MNTAITGLIQITKSIENAAMKVTVLAAPRAQARLRALTDTWQCHPTFLAPSVARITLLACVRTAHRCSLLCCPWGALALVLLHVEWYLVHTAAFLRSLDHITGFS